MPSYRLHQPCCSRVRDQTSTFCSRVTSSPLRNFCHPVFLSMTPFLAGPGAVEPQKRWRLLRNIREEGGFAFVSSEEKAAGGNLQEAEAAREMAWEQLHSGPWKDVVPAWRDAYALSCFYVAAHWAGAGDFKDAFRVLDLGIIMGGMLFREDLEELLQRTRACSTAREEADSELGDGMRPNWDLGETPDEIVRVLPSRSLSCQKVNKQPPISMETFLCDYFLRDTPVVLSGCIDHWPACTKWKDIQYLKKIAGHRTVPVEVGKNYLTPEWKQELITFSEFLERIQSKESCRENLSYLAQHPLFDQIQELRNDIMVPDYCFTGGGALESLNAWFGPAGTVTPLHHDPHHNLLAQIVGRKYVRLYPASVSEDLYPYDEFMLSNSSQVDLDNIDLTRFPKVENLNFVDCILEEGEMLYIPPKWWHYVRSLTTSFSVSFWWSAG